MIEVTVSRLGLDSSNTSYVVILQERGGTRLLPIWIGQPEAESIVMHMHNVKRPRPITHDLMRSLIMGMDAQLRRVEITRVEKQTYYAELHLQHGETLARIDARPSDGIAIALRLGAPIYAAESLLIEPGEELADDENDQPEFGGGDDAPAGEGELTSEQLKTYLENLRPEDFGKFNP
jgi:bifunctional DNase/RNase